MLTPRDIGKRLRLTLDQVAFLYGMRILPDGVKIGGVVRFRENDIRKFERYLLARRNCRERGIDPDSKRGPAPPVYSTAGKARFDPRLVIANEREAERQKHSRTLSSGSAAIGPQQHIALPEPSDSKAKAEG